MKISLMRDVRTWSLLPKMEKLIPEHVDFSKKHPDLLILNITAFNFFHIHLGT